ncbi:PQQ-like beta-propeller repeat protein [Lysobacter arenosi]|uniref:PQQ-like beta-propeller repeat protein n=1 Tax=Lysobacter arenosi TaxID=2795387 RepID=A0ABX7RE15_9GAMM|nr:PQQ-binding-like beta-propeller repeat protein [Lysobacter arenosi]QSX76404.1 PQQ-like beta-propeller repeat protein [Lysobacter arenosi]
MTVAISSAPVAQNIDYGDAFSMSLDGTWSGSNLGASAVYLQVADSGGTFSTPAVQAAPANGTFHFALDTIANVQAGDRTGTLTVRACMDQACAQQYTNASASLGYRLQVAAVGEWETIQRDATHNAYVPVRLDPTRFAKAWEWTFPKEATAADSYILRPVTGPGAVYVVGGNLDINEDTYGVSVFALDESSGAVKWTTPVPENNASAPAAAGGLIYIPTYNSSTHFLALDANNGSVRFNYTQALPSQQFIAPTIFAGTAYFIAGMNGNEIHAANANTGARQWAQPRIGHVPTTPAVDQSFAYYFGSGALNIVDRLTGGPVASLADPSSDGNDQPTTTVSVLGSRSNVIVNSYKANSYPLTSFNVVSRTREWSTQASYRSLFAAAPGVIYAIRRGGTTVPVMHAIDEATGNVVGTWSPPASDAQEYSTANVVATKNLVIVSTASFARPGYTYAVDRATMQTVWSYPESSSAVISANGTLYLLAGDPQFAFTRLIAFKTR